MGDILLCPDKVEHEAVLLILRSLPGLPVGGAPLVRHVPALLLPVARRRCRWWREGRGGCSGGVGGRNMLQSAPVSWRNTGRLPGGRYRLKPLQNGSKGADWAAAAARCCCCAGFGHCYGCRSCFRQGCGGTRGGEGGGRGRWGGGSGWLYIVAPRSSIHPCRPLLQQAGGLIWRI